MGHVLNNGMRYLSARAALLVISCCAIAACEIDMTVAIDGKNPPTFDLYGSGNLDFFIVSEVAAENQKQTSAQRDPDKDTMLWEIWPASLSYGDRRIWKLPDITYGKVPEGFVQKFPASGGPPALVEGKVYQAGGPASNANGGSVWFTIRNGQAVEVPKPGGR